jgi:transcriptional regulator with XRE-family HTH domain
MGMMPLFRALSRKIAYLLAALYNGCPVPRLATPQNWKLSPREKGVCLRVKEARNLAGVSQEELASLIGIPRDRLSTYEKGRSPIKFDLGLRICRELIVSEEWLSTGANRIMEKEAREQLPQSRTGLEKLSWIFQRQCYDLLSEPVTLGIPPGTLLSDAFENYLMPTYASLADRFFFVPRIIFVDERKEPELAARFIGVVFQRSMRLLDHEAMRAGADPWPVQRNFTRAIFSFCFKAYREFAQLGFDLGGFQAFVGAVEQLQKVPPKKSSTAAKVA